MTEYFPKKTHLIIFVDFIRYSTCKDDPILREEYLLSTHAHVIHAYAPLDLT